MPTFDTATLERDCTRIFAAVGLDAQEAPRIAHSLVVANLMGHDSHGVIRVMQYIDFLQQGKVHPGQQIEIVRQADASAVVKGGWGFGQTVCSQAMDLAIDKARARSVGVVELSDSSHIGRLGEYAEQAAAADMIGIVMCNNHTGGALQAPFGGIDPRMSPNPIAVGIPTGGDFPIVVDMTSSVVAEGKIRVKLNRGEEIPEGWAIDDQGQPVTDPAKFYAAPRGAILPFGGIAAHKGYSLAIVVDILSGALGGSGCTRPDAPGGGNGVFIMALDIQAFTGKDHFCEEVDNLIAFLKSSRLMPGFDEVTLPGELEHRLRQQRQQDGIFIDDETWRQIGETAEKLNVELELS